ncbi:hypothetical protein CBW21_06180 [Chromobacterium violaceum]|uniref:Uncharacterized protein n=2 Tax=Chromobacterium violaceum TaxID=536 RepID=A0A202BDB0_CHRVL|nr:hypothetical protein CBW21_06180 [Chromobacterium violaceum]
MLSPEMGTARARRAEWSVAGMAAGWQNEAFLLMGIPMRALPVVLYGLAIAVALYLLAGWVEEKNDLAACKPRSDQKIDLLSPACVEQQIQSRLQD